MFYPFTMKKTLIIAAALLIQTVAFAQGVDDACLFSQTYYQGTAKALGMGNALGAVGGDMTAVCINPASMGIYRSSELTTSLSLSDNYTPSTYYGNKKDGTIFRFSIPNVGYVHAKERSNYKALRYTQFGVGLTRTNDFNIHSISKGLNPTSSRTNNSYFLNQINNIHPDDLPDDSWYLWQTYLIDDHTDSTGYFYTSNVPQNNILQSQEYNFKGRSDEWNFTFSSNFNERLFIGVSLNLNYIKREGEQVFEESREPNANTDFVSWNSTERIKSTAVGCNAKLGVIYRANNWLRIGCAFHSPGLYSFNETRQVNTESRFVRSDYHKYTGEEYTYKYTFISPLKCVGSLAFVVKEQGMISLDMEYSNYGAARFKTASNDDYDYDPTNNAIKDKYGHTLNVRLGTEWYVGGTYLRFGTAYYGSPFGFGQTGGSVKKVSCGVSVPVSASTSFDFAYELSHGKNFITLYDAGDLGIESITHSNYRHLLLTTLKIRF